MRFRCYMCPRLINQVFRGDYHQFESDAPVCDKCGAAGDAVVALTDVHLLIADPEGPLSLAGGKRWRIGCQPKRETLAEHRADDFNATPDVRAVTCPSCRGVPEWQAMARALSDPAMRQVLIDLEEGRCC